MTTLYLTRHGETLWNVDKRMQGWGNSPLTDLGIKQAESLSERLKDEVIDVIYSSPIERAYKTAEILKRGRNIDIITHEGLKEIHVGEWEGLTLDEISRSELYGEQLQNYFYNPNKYKPFGGETIDALSERCEKAIKEIITENKEKKILIVTHGIALKMIMMYFMKVTKEEIMKLPVMGQAGLTQIEVYDDNFDIILNNDISHYGRDFTTKGW
ncbi:phosphatase [Clostridium polyendosporum]|uniref:Phosphatase n=1 Tax=Clostridium polyendosporum TaxID=69208 RepID=A0A919RYY2_9CLOT|nr:histidine phosphatase family protein [Clostridium polyendosporum]GIM28286.1 phosphatase [Clostridium polyendosporum]